MDIEAKITAFSDKEFSISLDPVLKDLVGYDKLKRIVRNNVEL